MPFRSSLSCLENSNIWRSWLEHIDYAIGLEIKGVKDSLGFKRLMGLIEGSLKVL